MLDVYYCPHHPAGKIAPFAVPCNCRKPAPGMILHAAAEHDLDLRALVFIGYKISDMQAAFAAGVGRKFLMMVDWSGEAPQVTEPGLVDGIFADLAACVRPHNSFPAGRAPASARSSC